MKKIKSKCVYKSCPNSWRDKGQSKENGITWHVFPKPNDDSRREAWLEICEVVTGEFDENSAKICSVHFNEDDFWYRTGHRKLKPNAVPKG